MHRWFFADEEALCVNTTPSSTNTFRENVNTVEYAFTNWTFKVRYKGKLCPNEFLALSGGIQELGSWSLERCIIMKRENCTSSIWKHTVLLHRKNNIYYRYAIVAINEKNYRVVRFWEAHNVSRIIPQLHGKEEYAESYDNFGEIDGVEKIERGWLSENSVAIQFKLYDAPFELYKKVEEPIYVRINLVKYPESSSTSIDEIETKEMEICKEPKVEKHKGEVLKYSQPLPRKIPKCEQKGPFNFCEVALLKDGENQFQYQPKYGMPCDKDDMLIFHITIANRMENIGYEINLYSYPAKARSDVPPYHIAYQIIKPSELIGYCGTLQPIMMCTCNHQPIGTLTMNYLIIQPYVPCEFNFDRMGVKYGEIYGSQMQIGHRGCGLSYRRAGDDFVVRENTIASFKEAIAAGADAIEFDISLTKDKIPVIYHELTLKFSVSEEDDLTDYDVLCLPLTNDEIETLNEKICPIPNSKFKHVPLREFTLAQLKRVKLPEKQKKFDEDCNAPPIKETLPFPRLRKVLKVLPIIQPVIIDIKWPMPLMDGTYSEIIQIDQDYDMNEFADHILKEILPSVANGRRIFLHIFNADLCTIFKLKQNVFPVVTLTRSQYEHSEFNDIRSRNSFMAGRYAKVMDFVGIGMPEEDLRKFPAIVMHLHSQGLILLPWGVQTRREIIRKQLEYVGVDAIIYDRINQETEPHDLKGSVFYIEECDNPCAKKRKHDFNRNISDDLIQN